MELTELIDHYRGPLVGLIVSWGAPWSDATDIAQDSLATAYFSRYSCRGDWTQVDVFGRWLRGVARNHFRNWSRAHRRRLRVVTFESAVVERESSPLAPESLEENEQVAKLRLAIARLSAPQRQVVLMHYLEETSVKEVAALLSVSAKTVEGRLYQARRSLRQMLDNEAPANLLKRVLLCL